ncbi:MULTISPECIES: hypothetical protein [unclassified Micromonospora]|uniref:hypothetical protein n=1 Tax=unclassified Micromonospora TaxID=2617518 RepID=UPI000EF52B54|nr:MULTISPECIES: hypothetical protein [unclassified Micromonospora]RLP93852.1 hypothetical protein EAD89_05055 [Micromonospora sp. BL4]RLP94811.1 hypothetical protein EAD98_15315 [Micromonospora sp. CV4]
MKPLAVHCAALSISYGFFLLRDVWCDAGDDNESRRDAQGQVAGGSTYQISVPASSYPPEIGLELRVWASEPAPDRGFWDGCRQLELHCPTGELVVELIAAGGAAVIALPQGVGVYGVRVHRRQADTEEFLIELWWRTPLPPADDDEDFYGDLWT